MLLLGDNLDHVRGALNLGGIANVTIVAPDRDPIAYDTGTANALIDAAVSWRTEGQETYDEGGQRAARGTLDAELLAALLDEPYYRLVPPKSTARSSSTSTTCRPAWAQGRSRPTISSRR